MSKKLDSTDIVREFVDGPCAREARSIIEDAGVLNIESEQFDESVATLYEELWDDGELQGVIEELLQSHGAIAEKRAIKLGQILDSAHTDCLMRRTEAAYLLGLAVGRQIGGAR